jgi:general nucleoside transport system permease protein
VTVEAPERVDAPPAAEGLEDIRGARLGVSDVLLYAVLIAASLVAALSVAAALLAATGHDATEAFSEMWKGSFGSKSAFFTTLNHTAPILVVAIGACVAGRAGLINIGLEGQFLIGGLAAVAVAVEVGGATIVVLPLMFVAAIVAGALWAGIAAALRYTRGISEVLSTLLLNFLAFQFVTWMLDRQYLLQGEVYPGAPPSDLRVESEMVPQSAQMPFLAQGPGYILQLAVLFAVVIALLSAFAIARTRWGFELRLTGLNPRAARRFGVSVALVGGAALVISGGLAGFAGAAFLSGVAYRVTPGFASNYGWEGLLAGLVADFRPLLAIPVAVLYGAVRAGGGLLTATGVSTNLVGVIQALIVVAVTLPALYMRRRARLRELRTAERT